MSPSASARLLGMQTDARLVELARSGKERAFEALVQRYRRLLLGYSRRMLLPEARAEDALQQSLLQAWLALQRGGGRRLAAGLAGARGQPRPPALAARSVRAGVLPPCPRGARSPA